MYGRKNVRTKKYTNGKMHRRKNAQTKNSSDGEMRDENKQIRLTARRKSARQKNLQTKNWGRKTAYEILSDEIMPAKNGSDYLGHFPHYGSVPAPPES